MQEDSPALAGAPGSVGRLLGIGLLGAPGAGQAMGAAGAGRAEMLPHSSKAKW